MQVIDTVDICLMETNGGPSVNMQSSFGIDCAYVSKVIL